MLSRGSLVFSQVGSESGSQTTSRHLESQAYRNHARVRTPVLAFFYSVFLHNQEGTSAEKGGFSKRLVGGFPERYTIS